MRSILPCLAVALPLTTLAGGCSSGDRPVPVRGSVTYRGEPLPNALVVFMPETPGVLPASGLTDRAGRFELMTRAPHDGAFAGKHRVTITARGPAAAPADSTLGLPSEPGEPLIPDKYFMPDTSGLTAEVPREGLRIDFALKEE